MNPRTYVEQNLGEVLSYLRSRFPMYHLSNFFFRDVQYGIQTMFREKGSRLRYPEAEKLAWAFVEEAERAGVFTPIDGQTWRVNYPDFRKPQMKKPDAKPNPAARTAPAGKPSARAAAGEKTSSPEGDVSKNTSET